jgi:pimeloyl-ACP methyl ester carboxylesterase
MAAPLPHPETPPAASAPSLFPLVPTPDAGQGETATDPPGVTPARSLDLARSRAASAVSTSLAFRALMGLVGESWCGPRPWAEVEARLPRQSLVRIGDQLVHVEQSGRGEPVLLVHGFGCSSHSWRRVVPSLRQRYRVLAPDLNGFGWTQRPRDPAAYSLEGQERLLAGVLDALAVERCHVVGHSYGGGLAIWLAARMPERVRSLTLVSSVLPDYSIQQRQLWARFRSLNWLLVHFFVLSRGAIRKALETCYFDHAQIDDALIDEYRDRLLVEGVEDAYYGLMAPLDLPSPQVELGALRVPTLLVWGDHDTLIPFEKAEPHLRGLALDHVALLARCGHAPMEERPEEMLQHLLPFLHRHRERWPERLTRALRRAVGLEPTLGASVATPS